MTSHSTWLLVQTKEDTCRTLDPLYRLFIYLLFIC